MQLILKENIFIHFIELENKDEENQPRIRTYLMKKKPVNEVRNEETRRDDETSPITGNLQPVLHLIESKPAEVSKKPSVKELARIFCENQQEQKPPPPPPPVKSQDNVPSNTQFRGRLPSKKTTGHKGISSGEGCEISYESTEGCGK